MCLSFKIAIIVVYFESYPHRKIGKIWKFLAFQNLNSIRGMFHGWSGSDINDCIMHLYYIKRMNLLKLVSISFPFSFICTYHIFLLFNFIKFWWDTCSYFPFLLYWRNFVKSRGKMLLCKCNSLLGKKRMIYLTT